MSVCSLCLSLFAVLLFLGTAVTCPAQQALLTEDTQINSVAATTNYSSAGVLSVNSASSTLVKFDFADILQTPLTSTGISMFPIST